MSDRTHSEVFVEFAQIGAIMRVTAIDAKTGTEAIIQGPATVSQAELRSVALQKLAYVMKKKAEKE